jgi:hypothetical protein
MPPFKPDLSDQAINLRAIRTFPQHQVSVRRDAVHIRSSLYGASITCDCSDAEMES